MDDAWGALEPHWQAAFELMWEAYVAGAIPVGAVVTDARQDNSSFRVIELFGPAAHSSAGHLRGLEPRLDVEAGLRAVLPMLLHEVL